MPDQPITRRTLLAATGTGALGLALAGCGGSSSKLPPASSAADVTIAQGGGGSADLARVPGPPAAGGVHGGRLVSGWPEEGNSYDPAIGYTRTGWDAICNLLFSPLYSYGADGSPQPNAAADMPTVTRGGTVYTIPLRPDVRFHTGRKVVAADYAYALDRTLDPALQSWAASYLYTIKGAEQRYTRKAKTVAGVKVVDDHTLRVTLVQPDVTFLYALTQPFTAPVPREVVKRYGRNFSTHVVGNGPYALQSYDSQGQRMVFKRFPGYFWRGLPYVDEIEYRWGIDPGVLLLMMQRGEVDMLPNGFATTELQRINASSALKPYLFQQGLLASRWVNLQPRVPAFRNPKLRQALNWATDREQLQRVTGGEGIAWGAPFPKDMLGGQRTFTPYTYDPARAKSLLRESGVDPRSVRATLWVTDAPEPQLGQVLQQQWKALGIDITLKQATYDTVNELTLKGKCDAWISTYYAIYPTAIDVISQYWETGGSANYTKYSNAQVDRLTRRARTTSDPARRNALLARAEAAIGGDAAGVFLENVNWLMGRNPKRIHNFHYSGVYGPYYDRLWLQA